MLFKRLAGVLILSLLFVGCSKEESVVATDPVPMETDQNEEIVKEEVLVDAVNIYPGLTLFEEIDGKKNDVIMAGEKVTFTGETGENSKGHNFYEIISDGGTRGWTWSSYIFENSKPAIIKPSVESNIFIKSNENAITSDILKPFTIVSVDSEFKNGTFIKVAWMQTKNSVAYDKYILGDDVSYNQADIEVARILNKIATLDNMDMKIELIANAKSVQGVSEGISSAIQDYEREYTVGVKPDLNSISYELKEDSILVADSAVSIYSESKLSDLIDFPYKALEYLIIEGVVTNNSYEILISNTSVSELVTLPSELSIVTDNGESFLGCIKGKTIPSRDLMVIRFDIEDYEESEPETVKLKFINGYELSGSILNKGEV